MDVYYSSNPDLLYDFDLRKAAPDHVSSIEGTHTYDSLNGMTFDGSTYIQLDELTFGGNDMSIEYYA